MNQVATTEGNVFGDLTPRTLDEAIKFAEIMSKSSIVPKDYQGNSGNILVAVQWGLELGLKPLQAMQNIAVINGRPTLWGDAVLALVRGSGLMESFEEVIGEDEAVCRVKRKGEKEIERSFSMDDAKRAGLAGKGGPWQQYPKRMLQMRARGFALRDAFTDVLRGMPLAEEAQDEPVTMKDVTPTETAPKTISAKSATEALRDKVAGKKPSRLQGVLDGISSAKTLDDLKKAGEDAKKLGDQDDIAKAREAYGDKLKELSVPQADPEQFAAIFDRIQGELTAGTLNDVKETYAVEIEQMQKVAPDLHKRLMDTFAELTGGQAAMNV